MCRNSPDRIVPPCILQGWRIRRAYRHAEDYDLGFACWRSSLANLEEVLLVIGAMKTVSYIHAKAGPISLAPGSPRA
jgi:hypothetical protein